MIEFGKGRGINCPFYTKDEYTRIGWTVNNQAVFVANMHDNDEWYRILIVDTMHPSYKNGMVRIYRGDNKHQNEPCPEIHSMIDRAIGSTRKRPPHERSGTLCYALSQELIEVLGVEKSPWILIRIMKDKVIVVSNGHVIYKYEPK